MKEKSIRLILMLMILSAALVMGGTAVFADETSTDVRVQVNGAMLKPDVPPMIKNGYTLIPLRGVFEELGGTVGWDPDSMTASVSYQQMEVLVPIGSQTATVNGEEKVMQIPAEIIDGRTLIPLRFVSESLGMKVGWDNDLRVAIVNSPDYEGELSAKPVIYGEVTGVTVGKGTNVWTENTVVTIRTNEAVTKGGEYATMQLAEPDRFVIDIPHFAIAQGITADVPYNVEDSAVSGVRVAQNTPEVTRVVVDLKEGTTPVIYVSDDGKTVKLSFKRLSTYFKPMDDGKLVVMLDPGHGAETGGKRSPDESLMEYEFNRSVANKVKGILEAQGVKVLMTVSGDEDTDLDERCRLANESDADVFVSIHANAFGNGEWHDAKGWEIYHFEGAALAKKLAESIQEASIPELGLKDRGVKTANFRVIKGTYMPAVLVEHGFYTNPQEVELLKSDEWRNLAAQCDANGIMNFLNDHI